VIVRVISQKKDHPILLFFLKIDLIVNFKGARIAFWLNSYIAKVSMRFELPDIPDDYRTAH